MDKNLPELQHPDHQPTPWQAGINLRRTGLDTFHVHYAGAWVQTRSGGAAEWVGKYGNDIDRKRLNAMQGMSQEVQRKGVLARLAQL